MRKKIYFLYICSTFLLFNNLSGQTFGVIGDYGVNNIAELEVSNLIKTWNPDFIITVGDNNYPKGDSSTIDINIGKYFHEFIWPYYGIYGVGSKKNRFFPSIGNHDILTANGKPYYDYFTLPGNERYYDFVWRDVHFFSLNSDIREIDGSESTSIQAQWLKNKLATSTSPWKIVYMHESPFVSDENHHSEIRLQWPFKDWGATVVLSGHSHVYERLSVNELTYMVNGLGGNGIYSFDNPVPGSLVRYNGAHGAMKVVANADSIVFMFINSSDSLIDYYSIKNETGIKNEHLKDIVQLQNYPNPFEQSTTISFIMPDTGFAGLKIYNLLGEEIASLIGEILIKGKHTFEWQTQDFEKGVYYYSLILQDQILTRKAILIR